VLIVENENGLKDLADIEVTEPPAGWVPIESQDEVALDEEFDEDG